ncbi:MAG: hypothetical protein IJ638_02235 [Alphaproteobacteria bacterium]|nr:hypothetical protein [Alphaproteobacteria bacterium]
MEKDEILKSIKKYGEEFELGDYVLLKKPHLLTVGNHCRIADFCRISCEANIGDYVEIAPYTSIAGGGGKFAFTMKGFSSLSSGVRIWLSSNDYVNELVTHAVPTVREIMGEVVMEKYTGIGANSVIMPNNHIPEGVTIGALSFVPENYPFEEWTVYAGCPIKPIKKRDKEKVLKPLYDLGILKK